jgi:hypothetical protein
MMTAGSQTLELSGSTRNADLATDHGWEVARHKATLKKLTVDYLTGLVTHQGKTESRRTLTQLPELPRALLRIVGVGTGIAIREVALEHVIHEDGQLARRGRDGLRFPSAGGQAAVEGPERRLGPREAARPQLYARVKFR